MNDLNICPYKNMSGTCLILKKGEEIKFSMEARCDGNNGYIVLTNQRIIYKGKNVTGPGQTRHYEYLGFEIKLPEITTFEYPVNTHSGEELYSRIQIQKQSTFITIIAQNGAEEMKQFCQALYYCIEQESHMI